MSESIRTTTEVVRIHNNAKVSLPTSMKEKKNPPSCVCLEKVDKGRTDVWSRMSTLFGLCALSSRSDQKKEPKRNNHSLPGLDEEVVAQNATVISMWEQVTMPATRQSERERIMAHPTQAKP
jgi:hypothetical protein